MRGHLHAPRKAEVVNLDSQQYVGDGFFCKACMTVRKMHIAQLRRPFQVARQRDAGHRGYPATVERVTFNVPMTKATKVVDVHPSSVLDSFPVAVL